MELKQIQYICPIFRFEKQTFYVRGLNQKNRSAMRTWGLMLNFIPFGGNAVLKYQHLGVDLLQVKR